MHSTAPAAAAPRPVPADARDPWPEFLRAFGWIGLNTFGGPLAQIGVMHAEAVDKRRWLTDAEFLHLLNFANILPGPEALEICIHLGWLRRGVLGGLAAGTLFIWPGLVSLTVLGWVYVTWGSIAAVAGVLGGIRPVAVAFIAFAGLRLALRALTGLPSVIAMAAAFVASFVFHVPFPLVLVGSGLFGLLKLPGGAALSERRRTSVVVALVALALAVGFVAPSTSMQAPGTSVARVVPEPERAAEIALISFKTAMLTFGGAYTALPYLREQYVAVRGWLGDQQMIDALALGETTPGPLISIAVFLAYLGGGLLGALAGGLALFTPSFVLVLGLGPHIEKIERLPWAPRFLAGLSAGTIGLILAMCAAVVPPSLQGWLDAAIAVATFLAVWRLKLNLLVAVALGAAVGLARSLL